VAAKIVARDRPGDRASAVRSAIARRRGARQRGLVVRPGGRLQWREVAAPPPPGPDGATVHPIAMATCDMDRPIMLGRTPFPLPLHLGHECVALVTEVGERVRSVRPGDRVVVPFQVNCGSCPACQRGYTGSCTGVPALSMYGFGMAGGLWGGAIADLVGVPYADAMLVALPDAVDAIAAASLGDNISDAHRHIAPHIGRLLAEDSSARVLILASLHERQAFTASMPLLTGLVALALGAGSVGLVDARPHVRELAARLGMEPIEPAELPGTGPAPLVVDVTGDPAGLERALASTAPDGICSSAGGLHASGRLPLLRSYIRNVTLHIGRTHARAEMPKALALMSSGRLAPEAVVSQVAAIDDAPRALHAHLREGAVKTVLTSS
jgi:alcohol dehydrogenase